LIIKWILPYWQNTMQISVISKICYIYEIETKQEFEDVVVRIINTKKIRKIIQDLINISGKGLKKYTQTTTAGKADI